MSHITCLRTRMTRRDLLLRSLADLECPVRENVTFYGALDGKGPNRRVPVDLAITVGARPVGFAARSAAGEFAVLTEGNTRQGPVRAFLDRLAQRYAYHATLDELQAQQFTLEAEERQPDGTVRLTLRRCVVHPGGVLEGHEIESRIAADGTVNLTARGMPGTHCLEATRTLEQALGDDVLSRELLVEVLQPPPTRVDPDRVPVPVRVRRAEEDRR